MRVIYVPENREIDLSGVLSSDLFHWLEELQGHCHRVDPILRCRRCDGALYMRHGRNSPHVLKAIHFSQSDCHDYQFTYAGMSPEHHHEAEYYARAAEDAGYHAALEVATTGRTIVDVVIDGPVRTGVEVQLAPLKVTAARRRTKSTMLAGITVAWSANSPEPPLWYDQVPSFRPTLRMWQNVPPPRSVGIAGPVKITAVRCEVGNFQKCPDGHRKPCHRYHPQSEPWLGLLADDVATLIPAGEMIPLQLRNAVKLADPTSISLYEELTGSPAAFVPGSRPLPSDAPPAGYFECTRPPASPDGRATAPPDLLELWPEPQEITPGPSVLGRSPIRPASFAAAVPAMCPGCRTASLPPGRKLCHACKTLVIMGHLENPGM
ncbi:MAG TPA: hypothetical protein VGM53_05150 [Streptosporangiaceae bacterium]|jgi:hypothetical protein